MTNATADITHPLALIDNEIAAATKLAGRKTGDVKLVAVSKTRTVDEIRPLMAAGQRRFGENRVQEAEEKWPHLRVEYPDIELHLIGQLQSNKAAQAVALFDVIHSLDRMSLLQALGKAMRTSQRALPCFVQVNIGDEDQKGGCQITELPALLAAAKEEGVPVIGLMCIPPQGVEAAPYFAMLSELAARHDIEELSMGMSSDFTTAIMLGATYVRVGTALFGTPN